MGLIGNVLMFLGSALSSVFANELKAWTPRIVRYLIAFAVRRLPKELRERFAEEWTSHVNDVPGEIGKITIALGFISAAIKMSLIFSASRSPNSAGLRVQRLLAGTIDMARYMRPSTELVVSLGTWAFFSVFCGVAPLIFRYVSSNPTARPGLQDILSHGDLLLVGCMLAVDGMGRLARQIWMSLINKRELGIWLTISSFAACLLCFSVNAVYWSTAIGLAEFPSTEISTIASDSALLFTCTLWAAGCAVIATGKGYASTSSEKALKYEGGSDGRQ